MAKSAVTAVAEAARPATLAPEPNANDTKTRILDAAFRRLATQGYAALSMREIARDAGVNHALINYHYRTKDLLVIAVLDEANRQLLQRQRYMYAAPGGFAEKWAQARRFYENDLASGFVRVQAELYAASLSNPELRRQFLPRLLAWKQVVLEAVREAIETYRFNPKPPFTAEAIACWISEFWLGMEFAMLIGADEQTLHHREALDAMQQFLARLDAMHAAAAAQKAPKRAPRKAQGGRSKARSKSR
jgi:AcrR family transcriptional regulator